MLEGSEDSDDIEELDVESDSSEDTWDSKVSQSRVKILGIRDEQKSGVRTRLPL